MEYCPNSFEKLNEKSQIIFNNNKDIIFGNGVSYQAQIETVISLIYDPSKNSKLGPTAIGRLLGVSRGTISSQFKRIKRQRNHLIGRLPDLDKMQIKILCNHIETSFVLGIPLKAIADNYIRLDELLLLENIPPKFVFNVDESGFQDFCDSSSKHVFVPVNANTPEYYYAVDRTSKRITLIGCIYFDGSSLMPCIVSPNKTVEQELLYMGYNESNCKIPSQESGFINAELFSYWAKNIFFKELNEKWEKYNYYGLSLLLLDGCTSHFSDSFLDDCTYFNVYPWQEPSGSSDQIQSLDLGIFGIQKKIKSQPKSDNLTDVSNNIKEIVNSWRKATLPDNVVSAFHQTGIYIEMCNEKSRVRASMTQARAVRC